MARVTTIHKGGSFIDQKNFRPISILNAFSKILETLMYNRVNEFCNAHNILSEYQFSFLQKRSTESALQCFTNDVLSSFDNNEFLCSIFLDFTKAFDKVDHNIPLDKLHHYGIRGASYAWFKSYLSDRKQFVYTNVKNSTVLSINYGVPQGSI